MIDSMRNAGATPQQANIVTNRVTARLAPRVTVQSTEISSMVARSLSHVNPTASQNYAEIRDQRLAYNERVNRLSVEIAAINQQVNSATARVERLDSQIQSLPRRITKIRQGNYRLLANLEADQAALSRDWNRIAPELRTTTNLKGETVRAQIQNLQRTLTYRVGSGDYNFGNLQEIESGIPELRSNLSEMHSSITSALSPLEQKFENINQDLTRAESTISLLEGASFPWEEGETPILAIKAKDLNSDLEGVITLTNLHFIFEHVKEVALKKILFVVTEKKTVREVMVQKPIGMVTDLVQGKVGFFKGSGLFVKFASEAGIPEMKFDTTGEDADWITKSYSQIISGQTDKELAASTPATEVKAEKEKLQLVTCPVCSAPYTEKVYRGQTSVNCKYCGALVSLQK
jgi:predicted  nucleic acid-binding Zn-ribbon protein